jgi:hypothetical protein
MTKSSVQFPLQRSRTLPRAASLAAAAFGLFFSGGEGIRLFLFPKPEAAAERHFAGFAFFYGRNGFIIWRRPRAARFLKFKLSLILDF